MYILTSPLGLASQNGISIRTFLYIALTAITMYILTKYLKSKAVKLEGLENIENNEELSKKNPISYETA
ncbi:hypothetical protein [Caldisalinibacter kiritimatiensis]|nr:hypothetical protein [Caldisalinibacter kiritimatiensis]